jgi:hypothetical protein
MGNWGLIDFGRLLVKRLQTSELDLAGAGRPVSKRHESVLSRRAEPVLAIDDAAFALALGAFGREKTTLDDRY